MRLMVAKTEKFIRNLPWRVWHFKHATKSERSETYGFRSLNTPPADKELHAFEQDLLMLVKNIKFRRYGDEFQAKMKRDIKDIAESGEIWVKADKTSNFYKMEARDYDKKLTENISKDYKKERVTITREINAEAKELVSKIGIEDRVCMYKQKEVFLTAKDHKPNFIQDPIFRLINPASTELGRISIQILEKASKQIREVFKVNLWISTNNVLIGSGVWMIRGKGYF